MAINANDKSLAYLALRISLGANMLFHGSVRLLGHYDKFIDDTKLQFASTPLPEWSVGAFGAAVPFLETAIGILLIIGLWTRYTALAGTLLMINLMFGMSLLQKWDIVGLQMNYVFFYFLILYFMDWNRYSVDGWRDFDTSERFL